MGPRSADRGNTFEEFIPLQPPRLQWGRDQLIAEMNACLEEPSSKGQLQWGRDQLIAEMIWEIEASSGSDKLQWGRDQLIAEIPPRSRFPDPA